MKGYIVQRIRCECTAEMMYDEMEKTVHCGYSRCEHFNKKFKAPVFELEPLVQEQPVASEQPAGKKVWRKTSSN